MNRRFSGILAVTLLTAVLPQIARSQGVVPGNIIIPQSSIERPADRGVRAHTYLQLLPGRPGGGATAFVGLGPSGGVTPAQLRSAYSLPSTGGSQIIAIVDAYDDPNALADFNTFSAEYGLPKETSTTVTASTNKVFQVVYQSGVKPAVDSTGSWELEEALDIQWAHAMAPNAKIVLVEANSTAYSDLYASVDKATSFTDSNGLSVKEVSCSWGGAEFSTETADDSHFDGAGAAYFVSAGDAGAPAHYPSASPYVISAGGTTVTFSSSGAFGSESGWSSGGGGPSAYESIPTFQRGIASIVGGVRGTPDIVFNANPTSGVSVYDSYAYESKVYGWTTVGGTSVAAPSLAGIANLAATAAGVFPAGSQALLTIVYSNLGTSNFRDITSGNNGYAATVGWDYVSGVGSCLGLVGLHVALTAPVITSLSGTSVNAGSPAFTLTVFGAGFVSGATVDWNGTALPTSFVTSTKLTASVSATDVATAGTFSITVVDPGAISSAASTFTVNAVPVVSGISPGTATAGGAAFTLTVTGTGFVSGSVIAWKGATLVTTYVSGTKLTAAVPASDIATAGTAAVTVVDPDSITSNSLTFTINNPVPVLTSLSPNSATHGSKAVTVTLTGNNFLSTSTVNWTVGTKVTTLTITAQTSTKLTVTVPATLLTSAGSAVVTVANPTPGGGTSAGLTFTIN